MTTTTYASSPRKGLGWLIAYAVAIMFLGLIALINPIATGLAVGLMLGLALTLYGVLAIVSGASGEKDWAEIGLGVLAVLAGVITWLDPFGGAMTLVWIIGFWLLFAGVLQLVTAFRRRRNRGWAVALGILDMVLGVLLLGAGAATALAFLAAAVGLSLLARGAFLLTLALGARRLSRS